MPKAKPGAKKVKPAGSSSKSPNKSAGLLKSATRSVANAAAQLVKAAADKATETAKGKAVAKPGKPDKGAKPVPVPAKGAPAGKPGKGAPGKKDLSGNVPVKPEKPRPRATKLPAQGTPLTKREMEQLLTAGQGRGVMGEGSLKGRLVVKDEFPFLVVVGRDKRELEFLLQGPDQEVLPAYVEHKVSVSGLIRKTTNYGGTVDVRKYSAKKPGTEAAAPPAEQEQKLRFLSPGEVEQICSAGMGAGMKGFASLRGSLEMTGDDFFMVVSNGGTRQQVSFLLEGKGAKGLRKMLGQTLQVTGVVDKTSGWGGKIDVENVEPRPAEYKAVSREGMEVTQVDGAHPPTAPVDARLNHGLAVRLPERAGHTWAVEPTTAKKLSLREANFEPAKEGQPSREFFFTPRNPGTFEVEFFLAKAFTPAQVARSIKLVVNVKP
ncbi:MAG TPA: protease inhibitor I42 family protein [Myxococcales bacterium]|nr:protease inhibitor I42 family protein [Myxococcales bacterium]